MKRIISIATLTLLVAMTTGLRAQNIYDAVKFNNNELNGTARFVGMGGAMGALGGDISTISTNPAGIGIYRSNDVMTTFSFSALETKSKFDGLSMKEDKNRFNFDNVGFVISNKIGDYTALRYVNFAFNYKRNKSFNKYMSMAGLMPQFTENGETYNVSQTWQMANQAYGADMTIYDDINPYTDTSMGWLAALGWDGMMIGQYIDYDDRGNPIYMHESLMGRSYSQFYSKETGGIDEFSLNTSFNFNDRVYLGLTVGLYDVNYKKYSWYDESYDDNWGYGLESWNRTKGTGFDVKIGAIVRPFETSPLRIGVAVHTPTFYTLTNETEALLVYEGMEAIDQKPKEISTYDELGGKVASMKYKLHTPWKYNLSLGYTVGSALALGAEYEYQDYSSMKFRYTDFGGGSMYWENGEAKDKLKGVSTLRLGAEYKFVPEFAFRVGYNLSTAAFKKEAWKQLPENSVLTDTDYANTKSISDYTFGFGYRGKNFYADLAYRYHTYKEDFYAFDNVDLPATKVDNNKHQVSLTLGTRF